MPRPLTDAWRISANNELINARGTLSPDSVKTTLMTMNPLQSYFHPHFLTKYILWLPPNTLHRKVKSKHRTSASVYPKLFARLPRSLPRVAPILSGSAISLIGSAFTDIYYTLYIYSQSCDECGICRLTFLFLFVLFFCSI